MPFAGRVDAARHYYATLRALYDEAICAASSHGSADARAPQMSASNDAASP